NQTETLGPNQTETLSTNQTETLGKNEDRVSLFSEPNIGKYKIIKTIGQGSFAKVKLARHTTTNVEVAIKIVDRMRLSADHYKKLKREIELMKRLVHPNVIQLFEVMEDKKYIYLVLEYAQGGDIFDYIILIGRLKEKEARIKFRQILTAVQYCHQKGVVHRDLKAENLLHDESEGIKLADFGFANEFQEGCLLSTFCGSPPYAAPELFLGAKYDGPKVDIWSLGIILYQMVSGSLPFDGSNIRELKENIFRCRYKIPFFMSTDCEFLLKKMIVFNPKLRSSLEDIMNNKWINMGFENCPLQPYKDDSINNIDEIRVEMMENMGFLKDDVMDSVSNKRFNHTYATYMLLSKLSSKLTVIRSLNSEVLESTSPKLGENLDNIASFHEPRQRSSSMFGKFMNAVSSTLVKIINTDTNRTPNLEGPKRSSTKIAMTSSSSFSKADSKKQKPKIIVTNQAVRRSTLSARPKLILSPVTHNISEQTKRRFSTKPEQRNSSIIKKIEPKTKRTEKRSLKKNLHLIEEVLPEETASASTLPTQPKDISQNISRTQSEMIQEISIDEEPARAQSLIISNLPIIEKPSPLSTEASI
ncbi:UNVERIFIED_CONTAM: hypothetical protein GTU68_034726, partial [Idotea baltica]|nr:hypothetical protein [Idotea baltica]